MEQILIRNLPAGTKAALKRRAEQHRRSVEAEVRETLADALEHEPVTLADLLGTDEGTDIGMDVTDPDDIASDPEGAGGTPDPLTGVMPTHAGHGTFIAGLLRQACPSATITGLRVMNADGVVPEHVLTDSLSALLAKQTEEPGWFDALVLSLGYYSESADDVTYTSGLSLVLRALADRSVVTFCAAGNSATDRCCYPAALAVTPPFADGSLAAVRALNPDGTVALFSNDGDWVTAQAPGANVVSTAPVSLRGAWQPQVDVSSADFANRTTVAPQWFSSGFAVWSGTSFAAPALAGRYLQALVNAGGLSDNEARRGLLAALPGHGRAARTAGEAP